jgi:hypothetical protein
MLADVNFGLDSLVGFDTAQDEIRELTPKVRNWALGGEEACR